MNHSLINGCRNTFLKVRFLTIYKKSICSLINDGVIMNLNEKKEKLSVKLDEKKVKLQEKKEQAKINHEERKLNLKESYTVELPVG